MQNTNYCAKVMEVVCDNSQSCPFFTCDKWESGNCLYWKYLSIPWTMCICTDAIKASLKGELSNAEIREAGWNVCLLSAEDKPHKDCSFFKKDEANENKCLFCKGTECTNEEAAKTAKEDVNFDLEDKRLMRFQSDK